MTNVDEADGPPECHERVPAQGDHRLRRGQRQHVARARQGQHGEGATAELGVVEALDHEWTENERAGRADHADRDDDQRQRPQAGAELDELVAGGEPRQPRQQGGLDRLEHEQRNPREQDPVGELGDELALRRRRPAMLAATTPALSSAAPKTEPMSSQPRFGVTSFQVDSGPG